MAGDRGAAAMIKFSWRFLERLVNGEATGRVLTAAAALLVIVFAAAIVFFIAWRGTATFVVNGVPLKDFLFSAQWQPDRPTELSGPRVGVLAFIVGSVAVSGGAVLLGAPLAVACAIFMVEVAPRFVRAVLQPALEMLAGIPSVVYGYLGLTLLVPFIRQTFGGLGFSVLAGILVLSVMILPTIVSVSSDSLRALPIELKEAAYALGSTRWQAIRLVLLPAARPGILAGVILGLARAFGEALAVQMVIGNTRKIPTSILEPVTTLTSAITMDMGNTPAGTLWNNALWSMGLLLLVISCLFILLIRLFGRREGVVR